MSTGEHPPECFSDDLPAVIGSPANAALVNIGVTTLAQVAELTENELLALHGVGPTAVRLLSDRIAGTGLTFRQGSSR